MPSMYTHDRFGREVLEGLPHAQQVIIRAHMELYRIGLQGPDILFYYQPLHSCPVNRLGCALHDRPGEDFFRPAARMLVRRGRSSAHLAYLYGFLCHFALDMSCHGFIDEWIAASGVPHSEIEMEFDRELLMRDGLDPLRHFPAAPIRPGRESARVIAAFFPALSATQILHALRSVRFYQRALLAPGRLHHDGLFALLRLTGHEEMGGMVMSRSPNPKCRESNRRLEELYAQAMNTARSLIVGWNRQRRLPAPWEGAYRYTFGSRYVPAKKEEP